MLLIRFLNYTTGRDLANSTSSQDLVYSTYNDDDAAAVGNVWLFSPSSITLAKNFYCKSRAMHHSVEPYTSGSFVAGYLSTTSAINAVQFTMSAGTIDNGQFKMYGLL